MSSPSILLVYQDEAYQRRVHDTLSAAGYEVRTAKSAAAAIAEVQRSCPRVVVLCPCLTAEVQREITSAVQQLHPHLAVLQLDANHLDDINKWPIN